MSEKKRQDTEKLEIDIASFEEEIDREIDSLFTIEDPKTPEGGETGESASTADKGPERVGVSLEREVQSPGSGISLRGTQGDVDLGAFELQIEKEIDALFVPLEDAATAAATGTASASGAIPARGEIPKKGGMEGLTLPAGPGFLGKPSAEANFQPDFSMFEKELDAGIDSLFIPLSPIGQEEPPRDLVGDLPVERPRKPATGIASPPGVGVPAAFAGARGGFAGETDAPGMGRPPELSALLESFSIAYLSLEWDFSAENIAKFDAALGSLEPFCRKESNAQSLHRLLKSLLHRLKTRPDSINAELSELVHEGQDLLRSLLISEGVRPQDKEQLRLLVQKFQALREKSPIGRKPEEGVSATGPGQAVMTRWQEPSRPVVADVPAKLDLSGVRGLLVGMESCRVETEEVINGIAGESKRLFQIEGIMARTPGLAPLKAHVAKIRTNLEAQISLMLSKTAEWREGVVQVQGRLDAAEERFAAGAPQAATVLQYPAPAAIQPQPPAGVTEKERTSGEIRKDDVCLFDVSGKHFAVLASQVVKVRKISSGAAKKLVKRGYATLADFKPLFRSLKSGVFGTWSGMPDRILGKYRFIPVPPELLHVESLPAAGGVLLVSSGRNHGLIFIDSPEVDLHNETEIAVAASRGAGVLGVIGQDTGEPVEVLNLDGLLKMHQGHPEK